MQSVVFDEVGEPLDVLRLATDQDVEARPGEALIAVLARPIHPADLAFIRGRYRVRPAFPQAAGLEGAGTIVTAPVESGFKPGARVAFRSPGTWAERVSVPVEKVIVVPDGISDADACQAALNPLTAWGLLDQAKAEPGEWVILTAATSVVAGLVARLCTSRGLKTIGVVRGDASAAAGRCLSDVVLGSEDPDLAQKIKDAAGAGAAALIDSVGGPIVPALLGALRPGGHIVAYGVLDPTPASITNAQLIYSNLTWLGFGIDRWLTSLSPDDKRAVSEAIWDLLSDGTLALPVAASFDLKDFQEALRTDALPGRIGKVLLT